MSTSYQFPFGEPLRNTPPQTARNAKAFVLGVYASAVHARWIGPGSKGKELCKALAVATEPCSFWDGSRAKEIVGAIDVPEEMGRLEPADPMFNGPSGKTLVEKYLRPLGLDVGQCWVTDLHDRYFLSPGNEAALARYHDWLERTGARAKRAHLPPRPPQVVPKKERLEQLREELEQSGARLVITLGNEPLFALFGAGARKLSKNGYGDLEELDVLGRKVCIRRLCHPRQAGALGKSSLGWKRVHDDWLERTQERISA